jgi:hypothetical protein
MPARINVYCRSGDVRLDPAAMLRELEAADLMTLAEALDLPEGEEAAVAAIRPHLRVQRAGETVEVHWKPEGRPIQIDVVHGDEAAGYCSALLEDELPPGDGDGARRVRTHLSRTRSIAFIQMAVADSTHLGATIGEVLAYFIAEVGDGLVWFYYSDWASPSERHASIWTTLPAQ